jgi:hypothetical protein
MQDRVSVPHTAQIRITIPRPFRARRRSIVVHAPLGEDERIVRDGVPLTTVDVTIHGHADSRTDSS